MWCSVGVVSVVGSWKLVVDSCTEVYLGAFTMSTRTTVHHDLWQCCGEDWKLIGNASSASVSVSVSAFGSESQQKMADRSSVDRSLVVAAIKNRAAAMKSLNGGGSSNSTAAIG